MVLGEIEQPKRPDKVYDPRTNKKNTHRAHILNDSSHLTKHIHFGMVKRGNRPYLKQAVGDQRPVSLKMASGVPVAAKSAARRERVLNFSASRP